MTEAPRVSPREVVLAVTAAVAVMAVLVAVTGAEGALGIPRNDDWSFIRNAFAFHDTGIVAVSGWVHMLLIGQLAAAYPVLAVAGNSIVALQLLGAAFGALLLVATYLLARTMLPWAWALLAAALLAVGPVFGALAVSFMTDVPAAALQVLALLLGVQGLRRHPASRGWLVAAGVVGVWAFSIREYSIVVLAVLAVMLLVNRRGYGLSWRFLLTWAAVLAVLGLALVRWRAGQVTENPSPFGPSLDGLKLLSSLPVTLGLLVLPAVAFVRPVALARRAWQASRILTVLAVLAVLAAAAWSRLAFLGNYWSDTGPYSQSLLGEPQLVFSRPAWVALSVLGLVGALGLALLAALAAGTLLGQARREGWGSLRRWLDDEPGAVASVLLVLGTGLLVLTLASLLRIPVFDRYFVAVIAPTAALAVWIARRAGLLWTGSGRLVGALALVLVGALGLAMTTVAAARDGARWRLAEQVAADLGVGPGNVDGGFEWFSFQTDGGPRPDADTIRWTWWTSIRDQRAVCATVLYAGSPTLPDAARPDPDTPPLASTSVSPLPGITIELVVVPGPDACPT